MTFFALPVLAGLGCDALRFSPRLRPRPSEPRSAGCCALALRRLVSLGGGRGALRLRAGGGDSRARRASLGPLAPHVRPRADASDAERRPLGPRSRAASTSATVRRQREALLGYTNLLYGVSDRAHGGRAPDRPRTRDCGRGRRARQPVPPPAPPRRARCVTPFPPPEMGSRKVGESIRAPINPYPAAALVRDARFASEPDAGTAPGRRRRAGRRTYRARGAARPHAGPVLPPSAAGERPSLVARLSEDLPERVVAEVSSIRAGLLVLADLFDPGLEGGAGRPAGRDPSRRRLFPRRRLCRPARTAWSSAISPFRSRSAAASRWWRSCLSWPRSPRPAGAGVSTRPVPRSRGVRRGRGAALRPRRRQLLERPRSPPAARKSVVRPGSHCPACGAPVRGRDNVPVVSWLLLGARCRDCRAPISPRYPLVELVNGALWLVCFLRAPVVRGLPRGGIPRLGVPGAAA